MGSTLLTRHFGLLNEHCIGCKIMNQKRRDDINGSNVTWRLLVVLSNEVYVSFSVRNYIKYI